MRCSLSYFVFMKLEQKLWLAGVSGGLVELAWFTLTNVDTLIGKAHCIRYAVVFLLS
jgi:hypothetical protein